MRLPSSIRACRWAITAIQLFLLWIFFDRRHYLLLNADVGQAVKARKTTAFKHYVKHGRVENRRARQRLTALWSRGEVVSSGAYFSGFTVFADVEKIRSGLRLEIYERNRLRSKIVHVEDIEPLEYFLQGSATIMFSPIPDSAGKTYRVHLTRKGWPSILSQVYLSIEDRDLFYSDPDPALDERHGPSSVVLSPVTQCNLNCSHCISRETRKSANSLSEQAWAQVRHHIEVHNLRHMAADYSGDIFYQASRGNPWLRRMIEAEIDLEFDTHANNLDELVIDQIMASKTSLINFSIDSFDPLVYRRIRKGSRPLHEVLDNVAKFMEARNARRPDLRVCISFVLMKSNLSSLTDAVLFAKAHNISWVQGSYIAVFTEDMVDESPLLDMQHYSDVYHSILDFGRLHGVKIALPPPVPKGAQPTQRHLPCIVPWHAALILGTGDVMACCMPGTKLGNLEASPLTEIWTSGAAKRFRGAVNTDQPPEPCKLCAFARLPNNFESYVPGLAPRSRAKFVARVMSQGWFQQEAVSLSHIEMNGGDLN